jgi:hypothetical protein
MAASLADQPLFLTQNHAITCRSLIVFHEVESPSRAGFATAFLDDMVWSTGRRLRANAFLGLEVTRDSHRENFGTAENSGLGQRSL